MGETLDQLLSEMRDRFDDDREAFDEYAGRIKALASRPALDDNERAEIFKTGYDFGSASRSAGEVVANAPFGWVRDTKNGRSDGMLEFTIRDEIANKWRVLDDRVVALYNLPHRITAPPAVSEDVRVLVLTDADLCEVARNNMDALTLAAMLRDDVKAGDFRRHLLAFLNTVLAKDAGVV